MASGAYLVGWLLGAPLVLAIISLFTDRGGHSSATYERSPDLR